MTCISSSPMMSHTDSNVQLVMCGTVAPYVRPESPRHLVDQFKGHWPS